MSLNLKYLIAARYVRSPKSHSVINIISAVSIVAMAVPVAAIILLLSIFNGLETMALENLKSVDSDLVVSPRAGTTFSVEALPRSLFEGAEGIAHYSYTLEQSALAEMGERRTVVRVKGVDESYTSVVPLARNLILGDFTLSDEQGHRVVAAHGAMQDLGALRSTVVGENMRLYAINRARISTLVPVGGYTRRDMAVAGIYSIDEDNRTLLVTSLAAAQELFNYNGRASAVEIKADERVSVENLAHTVQQAVGEEFEVRTREERNSIYRLMALEKWGVFGIAVVVMIIASLSIVGTLVMVIIDKRHDVQTLRTMGARSDFVRGIFIAEGRVMALLSLALGLVLGAGLALGQQHFGFVGIDSTTLSVSAYPVEVHLTDVVLTVVAYVAVSLIVVNLTVRAVMRENI